MPKLVRIEDDVHEKIFKMAESRNRTAGEIVDYAVSRVFEKDSVLAGMLTKKRKKPYATPPYGVPMSVMNQLPARVPQGRKEGIADPDIGSLYDGIKDYVGNGFYVLCTHDLTGTLSFLSGCPKASPRILRFGICPDLLEVKYPFRLAVTEESMDVFIPANTSAQHILHIIGSGARECFEKEYFTSIDLGLMWHAGFIVEYAEGLRTR
jgi:hypothetical protein